MQSVREGSMTEEQKRMQDAGYGVIYLAACAVNGTEPDKEWLAQANIRDLYRMSQKHGLTAIVYMALESVLAKEADFSAYTNSEADRELLKRWEKEKAQAVCKNLLLDAEREQILHFMEQEKIWYLPLKGILLKELYPKAGMRQMVDNDILYDVSGQKKLFAFMTGRGYQASQIGKGNHDVYEKPPVYNYEMHTRLHGVYSGPIWESYYADVKQRLIKDEGNSYGWHFSDEDFYIYLVTHVYKHYTGGGTGLRSLLDSYVYIREKGKLLNWEYIEAEMTKLGILKFEKQFRRLSEKAFSVEGSYDLKSLMPEERELLDYILLSGTYGTMENRVKSELKELEAAYHCTGIRPKLAYLRNRLFQDERFFKAQYPFAYRHRWARPFVLGFRMIRGIVCRRENLRRELRILREAPSLGKDGHDR